MREKQLHVTARVTVTLTVECRQPWNPAETVEQVHKASMAEVAIRVKRMIHENDRGPADIKLVGMSPAVVVTEVEPV